MILLFRIFIRLWSGSCLVMMCAFEANAAPLFDTHLHYNSSDAKKIKPDQIIHILKLNNIQHALVTSTPPELVLKLSKQAPKRILPLLGAYDKAEDKQNWIDNIKLPDHIATRLKQGQWKGIGELHLLAHQRHNPVFKKIIQLAKQYNLPLLLHTDPAVIDTVYESAPTHPVIWAHAGTFPYPDLIADYLKRYPALHIDLSVRDERIAPNGIIQDDWYDLFNSYPDRFMVGVDTYSLSRWENYHSVVTSIRNILTQLPEDVANQLAYKNAAALLK